MARYVPRAEPGSVPAAVFAVGMHLLLAIVLVIGLRWQTRPVAPLSVELWSAPPAPPAAITPPPPPPAPAPEPPKPVAKPPPPAPAKAAPKVDIALEQEKEKRAKAEKARAEALAKAEAAKQRDADAKAERARIDRELKAELERDREKMLRDQLDREQANLRADQARREADAKAAAAQSAAMNRARAAWLDRIGAAIKQRVVVPEGMTGNPQAIYTIELLPTGDLRGEPRLVQSSGNKAYDEAIYRAIKAASPLPKPDREEVFVREPLKLQFRPFENN